MAFKLTRNSKCLMGYPLLACRFHSCDARVALPALIKYLSPSPSENPIDPVSPRGWKVPAGRSLYPFPPNCWQNAATLWMELLRKAPWIPSQDHQLLLWDYSNEAGSTPVTVSLRAAVLQVPTWRWTEARVRNYCAVRSTCVGGYTLI